MTPVQFLTIWFAIVTLIAAWDFVTDNWLAEDLEHRRSLAGAVMVVDGRLVRLADDTRPLMFLDDVTLPWNRPEWQRLAA